MYPISALYAEYLRRPSREFLVKADINGVVYDDSVVVDLSVENNIVSADEFELGSAILSKLTLRLRTTDIIPDNARIVPSVALKLPASLDGARVAWKDANIAWQDAAFPWGGAVTEWLPLGEFFVDNRVQQNGLWTFTCYDRLVWADVPYVSALTYPATMQAIWDEICGRLGYAYDSTVQCNPAYRIEVGPAGYSMRQVLGYIASAHGASVYVGKDGTIKWRRYSAADKPVFAMTASDYIRVKQTNPVKTFTRIVVTYNTEDDLSFEAGSGDENHTLYVENPFATPEIVRGLYAQLNGFSYTPVQMDARGYPQIEAGDRIRYGQPVQALTWGGANVAWQDAAFTWDGYEAGGGITLALHTVFSFKGGLKMSIEAPSKSEQQSEFVVEGSLSQQINKLNTTSVRQGKPYYGLTITRTEGLTVEREDHASKVVLNSDEFRFTEGGSDALWFDVPARRWKFSGTLEGADGVFSGALSAATGTFAGELKAATGTFAGALQAATGTFSGNLSAAGGTFKGTLQAASGSFSGTITASSIQGGTIDGTTITGALIRTAASGTRIEFNSTGKLLAAYYDDYNFIAINPLFGSGPAIEYYYGGSRIASIANVSTSLWVTAGYELVLNGPRVSLSGGFSSLYSGSLSLQSALNGKLDAGAQRAINLTYDSTTKNLKLWDAGGGLLATVNIAGS